MTAPNAPMSAEEVLAVLQAAAWTLAERGCTIDEFESARTAVAAMAEREAELVREVEALRELAADVRPLVESLVNRIDADNCMTPQAVMVRRVAQSLKQATGSAIDAARAEARDG